MRAEDGGDAEGRHVRPELEPAAGNAPAESDEASGSGPPERVNADRFSPGLPVDPEGGGDVSAQEAYRGPDPQPSAVFLHSFPAAPPVTEAGLSLAEPAEPTTNETTDRAETAGRERGYTSLEQAERRPAADTVLDGTADGPDPDPAGPEEPAARGPRDSSPPCRSPKRRLLTEPAAENRAGAASVLDLSPGSEVRVCLDHVIDDALVVSFRLGEKVFSGVLMDVSKRFGPYGIPITVFPRRDDRSRPPTSVQQPLPVSDDFPPTKKEENAAPLPPQDCTSKPPPLDTYNQALPQPPPRKIKRPKRRYRCEEPTSIMNAIKLRPRQVLCDKCKGVVASGGHRETRRGPVDLRSDETSRRRKAAEGPISAEVKRLRSDDKGRPPATDRRSSSGIRVSSSSPSSSRRVLRGVASSSSSATSSCMRLKLNSKKVLTKGSADRSKARQVLKTLVRSSQTPPPQRRPKDQDQVRPKAVTRAATLQNHNQKVHFTRRLQHLSAAASTPLPPRMRLKPQRYRTDDSQAQSSSSSSSPPKHSARSSPPKPELSPASTPNPPTALPPLQVTAPPPTPSCMESVAVEMQVASEGRVGGPPSSSSLDSTPSECSSTDNFELPPPGDPPSSRRKSSTSSSSSSSSSSSVFSKAVSKCPLPDGRTICVGDIVWAKIYGFPWWPARVLSITVSRRGDTGLAVQQEARVSWFGSPTTSFLPLAQLSPFLETFQSRFDRKRKGPYRRAIAEAASAAKQLTPEVRALLTQFET
uniref:PWWP domain containing 2A n=1 Tax=Oreochromis niloticus TaxID=8128 RepID=A0A669EXR8_ORENI